MTNVRDITFESKDDALKVLVAMNDMLHRYGYVSKSDFLDLVGLPSVYQDTTFGWKDVFGTGIIENEFGRYILDLPKEQRLLPSRITIRTSEPQIIRGIQTVQHWQLFFDDFFIADTSVPQHVDKWNELRRLVDG